MPKRPRSWGLEIAMSAAFALWSLTLLWPSPLVALDIWLRDFFGSHRPDWAFILADQANKLGQGGALGGIALGLAALIAWRSRNVRPLLAFLATYCMTGSVLIVKYVLTRVFPYWPERGDPPYADLSQATLLTGLEPSHAYPSGHVLNTIVWYGFVILLVGAAIRPWLRRLMVLVPPVVVTFSTTYLGYHWFSDTPAGIFIGVLILRVIRRTSWGTMELPKWLEPEKRYL
ncbi:phosphatase PAP2 family protein [Glycomyces xiaoerkulensis]|uniref:phosphatase PAP2 family protein n=1 Tax=Glycomyces xiaoerkulensis TaxID=2038139 RepID=UPI000C26924E|nr:phosphatase PAP2 family protein [Glycomyces xiaoerkulensis]